ncbi:hypothetical protein DCS_01002 [Drechmeria coniospora]|uniref:MYND-type zinc finger protein samB n=1 Tax=Drechmeria coniospora TaxID=98403 RepID=A0A151GS20_DRECN|nr:hypothetical protein DCS_01002 [Drechmeria coniospora]KYK59868.1 hypothetical protein DCS_01002 [Drechmeria coniospora]
MSAHAMPEHWTELNTAKKQGQLCLAEVDSIKSSCAKNCVNDQVGNCSNCYEKVLDRIRQRYMDSQGREWFTGRKAFLHELEGLFEEAKARKRSVRSIEARIESEKEAWYRWVLRTYPDFITTTVQLANQEEHRLMLDNPGQPRAELVGKMLEGIGKPADWPLSVEAFAERVAAVQDNAEELKKLYMAEFFHDKSSGLVLDSAQQYLDEYRHSDSLTLEGIMDRVASDLKATRSSQSLRDKHTRRLGELRRARTAFEQHKKLAKGRLSSKNAPSAPSGMLQNPPACLVCGKTVDYKELLSCSFCQAMAHMGGRKNLTVYCTEECYHIGHNEHVEEEHSCEAGEKCVQLEDKDVEMNDGTCAELVEDTARLQSHSRTPGPSKSFSIDFAVPRPEADDSFAALHGSHEAFVDRLFQEDADLDMSEPSHSSRALPTPSASSTHSIQEFQGTPSFNLASAEALLTSFRSMLGYFPCILLPHDATVPRLAATRPFVLLAILAAASGSRTLQGHNLYDDEFRKVLGLKFVAGGERSLELLQGILIYCAWYPFHLRPKNKQAIQYLRMAGDLIHDLELDEPLTTQHELRVHVATDQQLDGIRAHLGYIYIISTFAATWQGKRGLAVAFTSWTNVCCDILEENAQDDGDLVLSTLYHLSSILYEASEATQKCKDQSEQHSRLILSGLGLQFRELQARLPPAAADSPPVTMQTMFMEFYLDGGLILSLPRPGSPLLRVGPFPPTAFKLYDASRKLGEFLEHVSSLEEASFLAFSLSDWTRLILAIIQALRLSFDQPQGAEHDSSTARSELQFGRFLSKMCQETNITPASRGVDVLSAFRVVLGVVEKKYERRLLAVEQAQPAAKSMHHRCPMLDGSLKQFLPLWDAEFGPMPMPQAPSRPSEAAAPPMFHDLWATMTMGWTSDDNAFEDGNSDPKSSSAWRVTSEARSV